MPYKSTNRPIIVQKLKPKPAQEAPKNIIIEYEKQNAISVRQVLEEGVFRVDPKTYLSYLNDNEKSEVRYVDRITELPIESSKVLEKLSLEPSNNLSSMFTKHKSYDHIDNMDQSNLERESYYEFLNKFLSPSTANMTENTDSSNNISHQYISSANPSFSSIYDLNNHNHTPSSNHFKYTQSSAAYQPASEYETITTTVPESLANKIIAEARSAGAINKTSKY